MSVIEIKIEDDMNRPSHLIARIDWLSIGIVLLLIFIGWLNMYAAIHDENSSSSFDFSQEYGKQLMWIGAAFVLAFIIMLTDSKFFSAFSFVLYGITILSLVGVLIFGIEIAGSKSWFDIQGIRIQPAEFAKFSTNLALAKVMSRHNFKIMQFKNLMLLGLILFIPAGLILLQGDAGSALVYGIFLLPMFREGMHSSILMICLAAAIIFIFSILYSPFAVVISILVGALIALYFYRHKMREIFRIAIIIALCFIILYGFNEVFKTLISNYIILLISYLLFSIVALVIILRKRVRKVGIILLMSWLSIGFAASVDYVFDNVLKVHQRNRINDFLGVEADPSGFGYNVLQSKIAIGSGGFTGKGYMQSTQIKYNFVPAKSTDFIFCTVGEEWGFIGSTIVILLFMTLILRIILMAERQRSVFSRVYGYGVASLLFLHCAVNIGMTLGLVPVVGIPLPFFSYGGSSLWAFTILIFIFFRLDANRLQVFR